MRTKLFVALLAALSLCALLLAGGASAQRAARQGNDNASGGSKSKRVVGVRSSDTGNGSRVTITADDSLKDYSAYRSGDRFYVVLPKSAAGARGGGSGRGYSDMQVQQRGDSVVLSYRVQPGAKPRVEQKFNRLDVVFDVQGGDAGQQAAAGNAARQQQQTTPAENRTPAGQQNNQTQAATPATNPNAAPERRQPTSEEAARTQAANAATTNTTAPVVTADPPTVAIDPAAQNPAATTPEPTPATTPAIEPQVAQAQPPPAVAPITTNQPAAGTQTGTSLGTFLIRNWALALVFALIVVGLGLIFAARRATTAAPAPVESLDDSATKLEEPRAARAKEASAKALKDASAAAQASTINAAKPSGVSTAESVSTAETVSPAETVSTAETASAAETTDTDLKPLAAVTALAGGAAAAKSRKQSRKEARQGAKRKKKGGRADEPEHADASVAESALTTPDVQETAVEESAVEEQFVAAPVAEETVAVEPVSEETLIHEETVVEAPPVEETAVAESALVGQAEAPAEVEETLAEAPAVDESAFVETTTAEASTEPEVAEHPTAPVVETAEPEQFEVAEPGFETAAPAFDASEVETTEVVAPVEALAAEPSVTEAEAPVAVTEIEPAVEPEPDFAPDSETVQAETHRLLEGGEYDRAVVGSRDAMARQMVAYELLSALAGRNQLKRQRAGTAFVEHGYFDETARDLREADAPAERSAAARSLALLGDRKATPLLVAALEDPVTDVRRAAVEALGALRDPSAVEALEALLERERNERNRIPPRVIRTAVEFCREGFQETPPAEPRADTTVKETLAIIPSVKRDEPAAASEPEAATVEEAARVVDALPAEEPAPHGVRHEEEAAAVEVAPVEEAAVETAPEPLAEAAAPDVAEAAEETSLSIAPFVDEHDEAEPLIVHEPAAEATGETAHVPEPVHTEEAAETGVALYFEPERPFAEQEEEVAFEARDESAASAAEEVGIQPFVGQDEEVLTGGTFDWAAAARVSEQATLFDAGTDEATREIEPVAADSSKELTPAAGEWFDFDISDVTGGTQPAAPEPAASEPAPTEHVFETSSGEALDAPAAAGVAEAAAEVEVPAPASEAQAPATRDIEAAEAAEASEPAPFVSEPAAAAYEPAAEAREKGLAPFDETSTVPAAIQQRIASRNPNERAAAIVELSHVDTDEAFQQICAAFDDDSRDVRSAAARALYELRTDRAESFTRALREATPERRREIGSAIATSGLAGESISQLTGESRERTYEAFSLLFLMAKAGEVQPLLRAIEGHPNNEVRLAVVKLLALSGQKEVLPAFRRLAVRGSLPTEVRSAVMEAIYQISSSQPTHA